MRITGFPALHRKGGSRQKAGRHVRHKGKKTIILGSGFLAAELAVEIARHPDCKYSLLGFISETDAVKARFDGLGHLGSMRDLPLILEAQKPVHVIVAPDRIYDYLPMDRLVESQIREDVSVETGIQAYEKLTGKLAIEALTTGAILFSSDFNPSLFTHLFSRISSLIAAGVALPMVLPLMGLLALAIKLDSPGPALYVQERTGLGGKKFRLLKFRSMRLTTASHSEWEEDNLDRITRSGKWLRKFRLDELPQFINVLRGDMNLVGPRPHPSSNKELFTLVSRNAQQDGEQIPYYSLRCSVRPGITGWAQVRYKYANGIEEEIEKLRYDLYYIKHHTPLLDLKILYQTVKVVLFGHVPVQNLKAVPEAAGDTQALEPRVSSAERLPAVSVAMPPEKRTASARQTVVVPKALGPYWTAKDLKIRPDGTDDSVR